VPFLLTEVHQCHPSIHGYGISVIPLHRCASVPSFHTSVSLVIIIPSYRGTSVSAFHTSVSVPTIPSYRGTPLPAFHTCVSVQFLLIEVHHSSGTIPSNRGASVSAFHTSVSVPPVPNFPSYRGAPVPAFHTSVSVQFLLIEVHQCQPSIQVYQYNSFL